MTQPASSDADHETEQPAQPAAHGEDAPARSDQPVPGFSVDRDIDSEVVKERGGRIETKDSGDER